jgi:hypothetical protein
MLDWSGMPADRLTHPRIGRSRKVTTLTDFEFRVWDTYRWAADDFGVMAKSASKLRGENDALRVQHTDDEVMAALQKSIEIDLITEFDHQAALYVCSLVWQTHQKIEHPRQTHLPAPSPQVIASMDVPTRKLFRDFHNDLRKSAASRARHPRETANGKRLTANGFLGEEFEKGVGLQRTSSSRGLQRSGDLMARFDRFWAVYPLKTNKDTARKEFLKIAPDDGLTDVMIAKVREARASAQWLKDGGDFIPHARTWLHQKRWEDEADNLPFVSGKTVNVMRGLQ